METRHLVNQAEEQIKHLSRLAWEKEKVLDDRNKAEMEKKHHQKLMQAMERQQRKKVRKE